MCLATTTGPAAAEVIERLLAIVSGHLIMASDVEAVRRFDLPNAVGADRAVLDRLIERALILAEVERYAPAEPSDADVTADLNRVRARFATPEAFGAVLDELGLTESVIRERIRQDLRIDAYLAQRFVVALPTDAEVEAAYEADPARFGADTLDAAREVVVRSMLQERRAPRVQAWVSGLRTRSRVVILPEREASAPINDWR